MLTFACKVNGHVMLLLLYYILYYYFLREYMHGGRSYKDLVDRLIQVIADCFSKSKQGNNYSNLLTINN